MEACLEETRMSFSSSKLGNFSGRQLKISVAVVLDVNVYLHVSAMYK